MTEREIEQLISSTLQAIEQQVEQRLRAMEEKLDGIMIAIDEALAEGDDDDDPGGLVKRCVNEIRRRPSHRAGSRHALR
jgi:hypothetical protein